MATSPPKPATWTYAEAYVPEDEVLAAARARAEEVGVAPIGSGGGAALRFLASVLDARAVVEIGTGTGVSGVWLLRGMRSDGVLTTVDIEAEHQRLARETYTEAGVAPQRVRTIAGAALDVLPRLTDGHYDLVFADGDKVEYAAYLKEALRLLRPGGVVAFDNALWHDRVADPAQRDEETVAIRELGREVAEHESLVPLLLPVGDGLLLAKKEWAPEAGLSARPGRRDGAARKPSPPSATATTSHGSIRIGARADDLRARRLGGGGREGLLELRAGLVGGEDVAALEPLPRAHPPGLEAQAVHAGEPGVGGLGDVRRELVLDALGRVGQRPADGQCVHQVRSLRAGRAEPSQASRARAPKPVGPGGPLEALARASRRPRRCRGAPTARGRRSAGGTGRR